jgi:hypothetical protein
LDSRDRTLTDQHQGVRRIDADGKTMTTEVVAIDPSSKETPIKLVFKRVAGPPG